MINIIYHINNQQTKNDHNCLNRYRRKLTKLQSFLTEILDKQNRGNSLGLTKGINEKPVVNIILNGKGKALFPLD